MALAMDLPTPMNSMTIFNPDFVTSQEKSLTSTKFWWNFSGVRAEGYTEYIKFFDPVLKELDAILCELEATEDESWVRSIRMELEKEFALLKMMKAHNRNYGLMYTKIKDFELKKKEEDAKFEKMKHELKELQDEFVHFQQKQRQDEVKLEGKLNKLENLILTTSNSIKIEEKTKKATKFAHKYSQNLLELDSKTQKLKQKSDEAYELFEIMETDKIATLVNLWRETVSSEDRDFKEYKRTAGFMRGGTEVSTEIDPDSLITRTIRSQKKSIRLYRFQKSNDLIHNSVPCRDYFSENEIRPDVEQVLEENYPTTEEISDPKTGKKPKLERESFPHDEEDVVKPFNIDEPETSYGEGTRKEQPEYKQSVLAASDETSARKKKMPSKTPKCKKIVHKAPTSEEVTDVKPFSCKESSDDEEWPSSTSPNRPQPIQVKTTQENRRLQKTANIKTTEERNMPSTSAPGKFKSNVEATNIKTLTPAEDVDTPIIPLKPAQPRAQPVSSPRPKPIRPRPQPNLPLPIAQPIAKPQTGVDSSRDISELFSVTTKAQHQQSQIELCFTSDESVPSTSEDPRPLPQPPASCWEESQPSTRKKEKPVKFTPYKVTVVRSYKKIGQNEMSVTQGERVKIISRPDEDGYVMAKKKTKFFRHKTGLIPLYTF